PTIVRPIPNDQPTDHTTPTVTGIDQPYLLPSLLKYVSAIPQESGSSTGFVRLLRKVYVYPIPDGRLSAIRDHPILQQLYFPQDPVVPARPIPYQFGHQHN